MKTNEEEVNLMDWIMDDKKGILSNNRIITRELLTDSFQKMYNILEQERLEQSVFLEAFVPFLKNLKTIIDCNDVNRQQYKKYIEKDALDILEKIQEKNILEKPIGMETMIGELKSFISECNKENKKDYKRRQQAIQGNLSRILKKLIKVTGVTNKIHAFMNDYNRIVYCSAFRRLQDKAQVFPLEKHDYARTRLTHSIEVSSISAQLGNITAIKMFSNNNHIKKNVAFQMEKILSSAALLHDIGNPPFGHFGEEAIKDFFKQNFDSLSFIVYSENGATETKKIGDFFVKRLKRYEWMKNDFTRFDGNAQSFRIATKTQLYKPGHSLELTGSVLGAIIKYPFSSYKANTPWGKDKFGFFYSEKNEFETLKEMGVARENQRNPLVFLLEAADDISYVTSDLDDAIKKGVLNYEIFKKELEAIDEKEEVLKEFKDKFEKYYLENTQEVENDAFELTMQRMINDLRIQLIGEVSNAFIEQKETILSGVNVIQKSRGKKKSLSRANKKDEHCYELLDCIRSAPLIEWIRTLFVKYIYSNKSIITNELAGYEIISYLLTMFVDAVLKLDFTSGEIKDSTKKHAKQKRVFSLISTNFVQTFKEEVKDISDPNSLEHIYYRLRLVIDYISGMTDSYAKEIYQTLKGQEM